MSESEQISAETVLELAWIHVSDIHFGSHARRSQAEKKLVAESLIADVRNGFKDDRPDYIFVTGDVAYSAEDQEYSDSLEWLQRLADAARIGRDRIWIVPGNHDVRRSVVAANPDLSKLHDEARIDPERFEDFMVDPVKLQLLESKLKPYSDWIQSNFSHIKTPLDWATVITTRNAKKARLAGLCTVWVSDKNDGMPNHGGIWSTNMFISRDRSLAALPAPLEDLTLLLAHHPRNWLCHRSDVWLETLLSSGTVLQLSGHVHEESAGVRYTVGSSGRYATVIGGAVHDTDGSRHGYAWGQLRFDPRALRWHLGWAPRILVGRTFTADRTNYPTMDESGYCWEPLRSARGLVSVH